MSRHRVALRLSLVLVSPLAPLAVTAAAQVPPCEIQWVAGGEDTFVRSPSISGDGEAVAFLSRGDFTGQNGDGDYEVFVWRAPGDFLQVVPGPFGFVIVSESVQATGPQLAADGRRLVYSSVADPLGSNPEGGLDVFLWDEVGGLSKLVDGVTPGISSSGRRVVFRSALDLVGENPENRNQIFLWDQALGMRQITHSQWSNPGGVTISGDGSRVAFSASNDPDWSADRQSDVVLWDEASGLRVLTAGLGGESWLGAIDADGDTVAINSSSNFAGTNPDGNFEILLWTEDGGLRPLTAGPGNASAVSMDDSGRRFVFVANDHPSVLRETYLWDAFAGVVPLHGSPSGGSISGDGRRIAFTSTDDLTGDDALRRGGVYLAACPASLPVEVPASTPAGSLLLALALAAAGATFLALRRV